jgi:regulator of sigma E protease
MGTNLLDSIVPLAVGGHFGTAQWAIAGIIAIGVLITFHEFGHFLVAKLLGIGVQKFSVGFGPTIVGKKVGDTEYVLSWIPLGGFVKMVGENLGDDVDASERARSFLLRPPSHRLAVVFAGPFFNLILAVMLFGAVFMVRGEPVKNDPSSTKVGGLNPGMPAYEAGLKIGDEVVAVNGVAVHGWAEMAEQIQASKGQPFVLTARRAGTALDFHLQARPFEGQDADGAPKTLYFVGIENTPTEYRKLGVGGALWAGVEETIGYGIAIPKMLGSIFTGKVSMHDVAGPLGIVKMTGQQLEQGFTRYVHLIGILSVNLGIFNLLPIPILDGGQFVLFFVEWVRRRPLSVRKQELIQQVGFYFLIGLMVIVVANDVYNQIRVVRRAPPKPVPSTFSAPAAPTDRSSDVSAP